MLPRRIAPHVEPRHQELSVAVCDPGDLVVGRARRDVELVGSQRHTVGRLETAVRHGPGDQQIDVVDRVVSDVRIAQREARPGAGGGESRGPLARLGRGWEWAGPRRSGIERGGGSREPRRDHRCVKLPARRVARGIRRDLPEANRPPRATLYYAETATSRMSQPDVGGAVSDEFGDPEGRVLLGQVARLADVWPAVFEVLAAHRTVGLGVPDLLDGRGVEVAQDRRGRRSRRSTARRGRPRAR